MDLVRGLLVILSLFMVTMAVWVHIVALTTNLFELFKQPGTRASVLYFINEIDGLSVTVTWGCSFAACTA